MAPLEGETGAKPLPDEALIDAREQADIDGPLVDWKSKGSRIELLGREAVDGHDAWKLKLTLKSGGILTAYVDAKSANLIRTEGHSAGARQIGPDRDDARRLPEDGRHPLPAPRRGPGRRPAAVLRIVVDKVEVNPPLSDARFTPPA